jgi:hypothetical protein
MGSEKRWANCCQTNYVLIRFQQQLGRRHVGGRCHSSCYGDIDVSGPRKIPVCHLLRPRVLLAARLSKTLPKQRVSMSSIRN